MIQSIFAEKDTTIYNDIKTLNTGLDEIIEVRKSLYKINIGTIAETATTTLTSSLARALIKFDIADISSSIVSGKIVNPRYYLKLYTTDAKRIQTNYSIEAYPVSESWVMGSGKKQSNPIVVDGASWNFTESGSAWQIAGAIWNASYMASQSFSYETSDIEMDVTNIVNAWVSGTVPNEGFILKFPQAIETPSNQKEYGSINFFSRDTNTIYPPLLQVKWDDSVYSTGSLSAVDINNMAMSLTGLRERYKSSEVARLTILSRDKYVPKTFTTSSRYLIPKYLPTSSYYAIKDAHTEEMLIPFDSGSTKLSCDSNGNYFNFDMSGLQPERYYKFVLKIQSDSNTIVIDDKFYFKVER